MPTPQATSGIVAQAFRLMEKTPPSSLADNSPLAAAAAEQYEVALGVCLEASEWSFARMRARLPQVADTGVAPADDDLPFAYVRPADLLRLMLVEGGVRWRLDKDFLWADAATSVIIRYIAMVSKEADLPMTFRTAVSYQLAVLLAPQFVGSRTKRNDLQSSLGSYLSLAKQEDARNASAARWDGRAVSQSGFWVDGAQL